MGFCKYASLMNINEIKMQLLLAYMLESYLVDSLITLLLKLSYFVT